MSIEVENIGGITSREIELLTGVSILVGENATNRTSFLHAMTAAFGGRNAAAKSDREAGKVTLRIGTEVYKRTVTRTANGTRFSGTPYLENGDDIELAELFAFLLEDNEVRRTVKIGGSLYDVLMRPVDEETIERRIATLREEKQELDSQLALLEQHRTDLPNLAEKRQRLTAELEDLRDRRDRLQDRLETVDRQQEPTDSDPEVESLLEDKTRAESELGNIETRLANKKEQRERIKSELKALELPDATPEELERKRDEIVTEVQALRERKSAFENTQSDLDLVIDAHRSLRQGTMNVDEALRRSGIPESEFPDGPLESPTESDADNLTSEFVASKSTRVCGVCGTDVDTDTLESLSTQLRAINDALENKAETIQSDIDELNAERKRLEADLSAYREAQQQHQDLERRLDRVENTIGDLKAKIRDQQETISSLESEIERQQTEQNERLIELNEQLSETKTEIKSTESTLDAVETDIERKEAKLAKEEELRSDLGQVRAELNEQRDRIDQLERHLVKAFNEHMDEILGVLAYDNIERIWLERQEQETREGRRKVRRTEFAVHVVRNGSDGAYEDVLENLSESEREVVGLVVGLAGHLAHDVGDTVPVMLLDSVEMIDAERLARLVEYLSTHTDYLIAAMLPGNVEEMDQSSVTLVDW